MVYAIIENSKYGNSLTLFKKEEDRQEHIKNLLEEYSTEYGKKINEISELIDITFGEVWIDLYEEEVQ